MRQSRLLGSFGRGFLPHPAPPKKTCSNMFSCWGRGTLNSKPTTPGHRPPSGSCVLQRCTVYVQFMPIRGSVAWHAVQESSMRSGWATAWPCTQLRVGGGEELSTPNRLVIVPFPGLVPIPIPMAPLHPRRRALLHPPNQIRAPKWDLERLRSLQLLGLGFVGS